MPLIKVPQCDPGSTYQVYKDEIDSAISNVMESGWYILGDQVKKFEESFASYHSVGRGIGVGSGTDALVLALKVCNIGPGDAVITVSHTAVATVSAISVVGALPVLVDVNVTTYTMDVDKLEETVASFKKDHPNVTLKAIIPVHLYGYPCDMDRIKKITNEHGLYLIEDCAQAHGAEYKGSKAGGYGQFSAFSFYPTKNLGAFGDGGILLANDDDLAERAKQLREYGWKERYISYEVGMNTRLDELQAAILSVKLKYLEKENENRISIANHYSNSLNRDSFSLPFVVGDVKHVFHQYVIRVHNREELMSYMRERGIGTAIHYPLPVHQQPAYRERISIGAGGLGVTESITTEIVSLPIYPQLKMDQVDLVCDVMNDWARE